MHALSLTGRSFLGFLALGLLLLGMAAAWAPVWIVHRRGLAARGRVTLVWWGASALLWVVLLLRPHQDTFVGLDTSGYRHMATAVAEGRPLRSVDEVLAGVPREMRPAFLLYPDMKFRNTRDRSFQLMSLRTCETEPFFYPLLPLAAAGWDRIVPGAARDYLAPTLGWLCVVTMLGAAASAGGSWGLLAACALLLGSPMPVWFLRGYFPEAVGALLVCGVLLGWATGAHRGWSRVFAGFALGMAVSLHPLLVVMAAPALWFLIPAQSWRFALGAVASFAAGTLPLYVMTRWICRPYGDIFQPARLLQNMAASGEHRATMLGVAAASAVLAAGLLCPAHWRSRVADAFRGRADGVGFRALWLVFALMPVLLLRLWAPTADLMGQGGHEFGQAVRLALGLLMLVCIAGTIGWKAPAPAFALLLFACLLAPVFFYLKGVEQVGLWSQRRLFPWFLLVMTALIPAAGRLGAALGRGSGGRPARLAFAALALAAALMNPLRWPAPYLARFESGAEAWIERLAARMDGRLTVFDYHSYSFPLSVSGQRPVLGLGDHAQRFLPGVMTWLAGQAAVRPVLFATAYRNPGLEEGVRLRSLGSETAGVTRVRGKSALPSVAYTRDVAVEFLEAIPMDAEGQPPSLHKVFDGGPLALREPWRWTVSGARDEEGTDLPAMWCRQGGGVIGPVPRPGERVRIVLRALGGRRDADTAQRVRVVAPWGALGDLWHLSNRLATVEAVFDAPPAPWARTGMYGFLAENPYDPGSEGLRGYPRDLVALMHEVAIDIIPAESPGR